MKFTLDDDAQLTMVNRTADAFVKRAVRRCMKVLDYRALQRGKCFGRN